MKRFGLMTVIMLLAMLCISGLAEEGPAVLAPVEAEPLTEGIPDGDYEMDILSLEEGYLDVKLYKLDLYEAEAVRNIAAGDRIMVNGVTYTVSEVADHGDEVLEIIPEEEFYGYIVLYPCWVEGYYYAVQDDWSPSTWVGDAALALPLPDGLSYIEITAGEETDKGADALMERLAEEDGASWFSQYNTTATFKDGVLTMIQHSDYPEGPEETEE